MKSPSSPTRKSLSQNTEPMDTMKTQHNDPKGAAGALKTPLGLIPPFAMAQTAWAHKLGADKYGPFNWRDTGVCASTYVNAMLRHLNAWRDGEDLDPESGISHLAHIACNCNILLDAGFCRTLQDDRNVTPQNWLKPEQKFEGNPVYRDLERGDALQEGDEVFDWTSNEWIPTNSVGSRAGSAHYRREIKPKPVYRELEVGELLREDDEVYIESEGWQTYGAGGHPVQPPWSFLNPAGYYRRKIEPEPEADAYGAECMCGRLLINHYTLGMICEDCDIQWQDPY